MDGKAKKFKQQVSKSHEKILKVIMQKYKSVLQRSNKKVEATGSDEESLPPEEENLVFEPAVISIKVDDATLERQRRAEQAHRIMGAEQPQLAALYINNEITLAQLKQNYYSVAKKIDYMCYDNLKVLLNLKEPSNPNKFPNRECYSHLKSNSQYSTAPAQHPRVRSRPQSASWNYNTKVPLPSDGSRITSGVYNTLIKPKETEKSQWNPSVKADPGLLSEEYRRVNVTNDRRERPKSSILHGGRLSAKAMHDIMVESIFPYKKVQPRSTSIDPSISSAVKIAAERVKSYKNRPYGRSLSFMLKSRRKSSKAEAEVRDIIYLS